MNHLHVWFVGTRSGAYLLVVDCDDRSEQAGILAGLPSAGQFETLEAVRAAEAAWLEWWEHRRPARAVWPTVSVNERRRWN